MLSIGPLRVASLVPSVVPFVLLVDDHAPSLCKLQQVVQTAGHACAACPSASDALDWCLTRRPALVVTDLAMPEIDGLSLARRLKERFPTLPIVLLTGELLDPPARTVLARTFSAVLSKPLQVVPFLGLIDRLLPVSGGRTQPGP